MPESIGSYIDIKELVEWENNPRHNGAAVEEVAKSIKRFGFASPIIARKEDNMVIAGHTRLAAARSLGLDKVPVRFVDLDPTEAQLLALADNKIGEIADWDKDLLSEILTDLQEHDLTGIGFSDTELDELISSVEYEPVDNLIEGDLEDEDWDQMPNETAKIARSGGFYQIGGQQVACGDCVEVMRGLPANSIDSIVTDPPYGIGFMSKDFDSPSKMLGQMSTGHEQRGAFAYGGTHSRGYADNDNEIFQAWSERWLTEAFRVLKDGGHIIAFAATRTVHRLTVAVEDAGFEIRDQLGWCYYSGFPKSLNISKQIEEEDLSKLWEGWGTALKPAYEPCVLARKPIAEKNVASQVLKTGTGAINIDACRFAYGDPCWIGPQDPVGPRSTAGYQTGGFVGGKLTNPISTVDPQARWPANLYQCPKPSRSEREEGLEDLEAIAGFDAVNRKEGSAGVDNPRAGAGRTAGEVKNFHPTVKPVNLMRWLIRLVTPPNGLVLEPFLGSGTTGVASSLEGFRSIGIEKEESYADICLQRILNAEGGEITEIEALKIERLEEETWPEEQS
jgi:DNA modification methylase